MTKCVGEDADRPFSCGELSEHTILPFARTHVPRPLPLRSEPISFIWAFGLPPYRHPLSHVRNIRCVRCVPVIPWFLSRGAHS